MGAHLWIPYFIFVEFTEHRQMHNFHVKIMKVLLREDNESVTAENTHSLWAWSRGFCSLATADNFCKIRKLRPRTGPLPQVFNKISCHVHQCVWKVVQFVGSLASIAIIITANIVSILGRKTAWWMNYTRFYLLQKYCNKS